MIVVLTTIRNQTWLAGKRNVVSVATWFRKTQTSQATPETT